MFPAEVVKVNVEANWSRPGSRGTHVIPQGRTLLPAVNGDPERIRIEETAIANIMRPTDASSEDFIVIGCGTVYIRKGVDLFLSVATQVYKLHPTRRIRFVWAGGGYDPDMDTAYSAYIKEQIDRANLGAHVALIGEIAFSWIFFIVWLMHFY